MTKQNNVAANEAENNVFEGMTLDHMQQVDALKVNVQPRTMPLAKPKHFYFEPVTPLRRDMTSGNDRNAIAHGVHQVDANREVSYVPQMPCLDTLAKEGNAYAKDSDKIVTYETYKDCHLIARAVFFVLKRAKQPMTRRDIQAAVEKTVRVEKTESGKLTQKAKYAVRDTLRDLRCYGLLLSDKAECKVNTRFILREDWQNVERA